MTRYYPIYARRSDGKATTSSRGKRQELNRPTEEQMDSRPNKDGVSDFYREVLPNEAKHVDWRRKLGGMLARELSQKDSASVGHILVVFPENYRLFEHIKKSEKDGKTEVKAKTHAAGGNDRQDAYLYGHPDGRRKRFRSPADFFPHLLWLCTDESGDPDNCSCKLCCPEELDTLIPGAKAPKIKEPERRESEKRESEKREPVRPEPAKSQAVKPPEPRADRPPNTSSPVSPPLPQIRSLEQQIDSQYRGFKYRPGELCWFRRDSAWGLGIVLRRWNRGQQNYTVQPLSHPYQHLEAVIKSSDDEMRPWLAWSVPKFTFAGLNDLPEPPRFDTVDWQGLLHNRYGTGNLEVDGSILAAKAIDSSYTPFNPSLRTEREIHYDGIYIGGEKVWVGEAVRLTLGTGTDIMIVHAIVEQIDQSKIALRGDIYTLTTVEHADPSKPSPASPMRNLHLPTRLTEDLALRNASSIAIRKMASYWKLTATQRQVELNSIKGRWYEASLLLPVLQPQAYEAMLSKGNIQESSLYMNARGDCLQANRDSRLPKASPVNIRRNTRLEALAGAVPRDTQIVEGTDLPETRANNDLIMLDPQFDANNALQHATDDGNGAIDQFMNLDGMEGDSGPYNQRYQTQHF